MRGNGPGLAGLVAAAALVALSAGEAAAERFTAGEVAALGRGEVVRRERPENGKDGVFGGTGYALIEATPGELFGTIQDWDRYPRIFDNVVESRLLSQRNGRSLVRMRIGHPVISVTYHVEMTPEPSSWTMRFRQIDGFPNDLDDITGYWRLFPAGEGRTIVAYALEVRVPMGIVNFLPKAFQRQAVASLLGVPGILREWMEKRPGDRQP